MDSVGISLSLNRLIAELLEHIIYDLGLTRQVIMGIHKFLETKRLSYHVHQMPAHGFYCRVVSVISLDLEYGPIGKNT